MNSIEIKAFAVPPAANAEHIRNMWLREIALQLAIRNECAEPAAEKQDWVMNTTHMLVLDKPFPFVHSDGYRGGREWWGVWYGPGPAARSFPTKQAARKYLKENPPLTVPPLPKSKFTGSGRSQA